MGACSMWVLRQEHGCGQVRAHSWFMAASHLGSQGRDTLRTSNSLASRFQRGWSCDSGHRAPASPPQRGFPGVPPPLGLHDVLGVPVG